MAKRRICSNCEEEKDIDGFYYRSDKKHLLQSHCKDCISKKRKLFHTANKDKIATRDKKYYEQNKEKKLERDSEYHKRNNHKTRENYKKRFATDINFRLRKRLSARLRTAVDRNYIKSSCIELIGCSIQEFKKHIERSFATGMNWQKFFNGEIHIDHIIPCASFNLANIEEQKKCFHFTNLQPLYAKDNISKSNKMIGGY